MVIKQYSRDLIPQSNYALFVAHQQIQPYKKSFNYFDLISYDNISNYCNQYDIDFIILRDFKTDIYSSTEDDKFLKRINKYPFIVINDLVTKYQYVFVYASNQLLTKNMPDIRSIIGNGTFNCIVPFMSGVFEENHFTIKYQLPRTNQLKNRRTTLQYYHNTNGVWWSGPGYIVDKDIPQWIDGSQICSYRSNDMAYRYELYLDPDIQNKILISDSMNMLEFDYFFRMMFQNNKENELLDQWLLFQKLKLIDMSKYLENKKYTSLFFGGCGSYSTIWKLRFLTMKYINTKYKQYIW